jgi:hypothetical protein
MVLDKVLSMEPGERFADVVAFREASRRFAG